MVYLHATLKNLISPDPFPAGLFGWINDSDYFEAIELKGRIEAQVRGR